jgi:hypothetical protein
MELNLYTNEWLNAKLNLMELTKEVNAEMDEAKIYLNEITF